MLYVSEEPASSSDIRWRMLTYAHVCSRMLTYAHVCSRIHSVKFAYDACLFGAAEDSEAQALRDAFTEYDANWYSYLFLSFFYM